MAFRHRRLELDELQMLQQVHRLLDWFKAARIAVVRPPFIHRAGAMQVIQLLLIIKSLKSALSIKMAKWLIDNMWKESSWVKVASQNAMSSFKWRQRQLVPPKLSRSLRCREVGQNKSWWVKSKFTGLSSMPMWLSSFNFSRIVKMCISCLSSARIRAWTNFWSAARDSMNSRSSATPSRLSTLSSICIRTVWSTEIWNSVTYF